MMQRAFQSCSCSPASTLCGSKCIVSLHRVIYKTMGGGRICPAQRRKSRQKEVDGSLSVYDTPPCWHVPYLAAFVAVVARLSLSLVTANGLRTRPALRAHVQGHAGRELAVTVSVGWPVRACHLETFVPSIQDWRCVQLVGLQERCGRYEAYERSGGEGLGLEAWGRKPTGLEHRTGHSRPYQSLAAYKVTCNEQHGNHV